MSGHSDYIQCLTLRTKHSQCVSGAEDGTVRLWGMKLHWSSIPYSSLVFLIQTVSYTPVFSAWIYGPSAKHTGYESEGEKWGSMTNSADLEN